MSQPVIHAYIYTHIYKNIKSYVEFTYYVLLIKPLISPGYLGKRVGCKVRNSPETPCVNEFSEM